MTTTTIRTVKSAKKANTKPKRYTISDGTLLLNLEVEGKWFVVTSPMDPELVTQARTVEEAFRMAYDAKELLEKYRAGLTKEAKSRKETTSRRRGSARD